MSEYTAEQAEHRANHFENAGILDIAAMLRAYAATLRQQATNPPEIGSKLVGDGAVSDEVVGAAWNAYEQSLSARERFTQAYKRTAMRAALEAVWKDIRNA